MPDASGFSRGAGRTSLDEIDLQIRDLTGAQVARRVERIRLDEDPALLVERQLRDVTGRAADRSKACSPRRTACSITGSRGMTRPGTCSVAWNSVTAVTSARVISFLTPSPSGSVSTPKRSVDWMPWWWLNAVFVNSRSETTLLAWCQGRMTSDGGLVVPVEIRLTRPRPVTFEVSQTPFVPQRQLAEANALRDQFLRFAVPNRVARALQLLRHLPREHLEVARAEHPRRRAQVAPRSAASPARPSRPPCRASGACRPGRTSSKSKRWPRTKTLVTKSPPPPTMPCGALWQPAHEFASGAETRLNVLTPFSGAAGSVAGRPVPFVKGRPPPFSPVQ